MKYFALWWYFVSKEPFGITLFLKNEFFKNSIFWVKHLISECVWCVSQYIWVNDTLLVIHRDTLLYYKQTKYYDKLDHWKYMLWLCFFLVLGSSFFRAFTIYWKFYIPLNMLDIKTKGLIGRENCEWIL